MREWGVEVGPTEELGHIAQSRAITPHKNPGVGTMVGRVWPGVQCEGKEDGTGPRISDWSRILTAEQERYANNDGYTEERLYSRMMQIMDPKAQTPLRQNDVAAGVRVTLYSRRWTARVAEGVLEGTNIDGVNVIVSIDLSNDGSIFAPGYHVEVIGRDNASSATKQSLAHHIGRHEREECDGCVKFS